MRLKTALLSLFLTLPVSAFSGTVLAADSEGWTQDLKADMVRGCVDAFKKSADAGKKASDSDQAAYRETCTCTIDRVAQKHSFKDVQKNPDLMKQEAERVGTPQGCPLGV